MLFRLRRHFGPEDQSAVSTFSQRRGNCPDLISLIGHSAARVGSVRLLLLPPGNLFLNCWLQLTCLDEKSKWIAARHFPLVILSGAISITTGISIYSLMITFMRPPTFSCRNRRRTFTDITDQAGLGALSNNRGRLAGVTSITKVTWIFM